MLEKRFDPQNGAGNFLQLKYWQNLKMLSALRESLPVAGEAPVESLEGVCCVVVSILFLTIKFALGIPGIHAKVSWAVRGFCP